MSMKRSSLNMSNRIDGKQTTVQVGDKKVLTCPLGSSSDIITSARNPGQKSSTNTPKSNPELENLRFDTIPPRYPDCPDDTDGHAELITLSYGDALSKVVNAPGYPKPVPKTVIKNYVIKPTEKTGLGMFATRDIQKGDLLFAERPFFCSPQAIANGAFDEALVRERKLGFTDMVTLVRALAEKRLEHMVSRMSEIDREALMSLVNAHESEEDTGPITGRMRTNCYGIRGKLWDDVHEKVPDGMGGTMKLGYMLVGRDSSRINHSCMANVIYFFDLASFSIQFFAAKSIESGNQIFYSYSEPRDSLAVRRLTLSRYGIVCKCYACTSSTPESEALRANFPKRIDVLWRACNDLLGGLSMSSSDGAIQPPSPKKPYNELVQGPKLKKKILEPLLRLQADIEREGLGYYREVTPIWAVLARAWEVIPGKHAVRKRQDAIDEALILVKLHQQPF